MGKVEKKLQDMGFKVERIQGSGKHRYLMPLDKETRASIIHLAKPYPKRINEANSSDQLESGGATPTYTLQPSKVTAND